MSFNQIEIIGNLGKDAEVREVNDLKVVTFSVAVTEKWTDKDGNAQEHTDWFTVDYFCKSAGIAAYLKKGIQVFVLGRMVSREYEKDGQKRIAWSVRAATIKLLGDKKEEAKAESSDAPF